MGHPGERTVTLWVVSPTGEMASTTASIDVNDVVEPVARIGGNGQPNAGGWRLLVNDALTLNCDSSSDDHEVSLCAWTLDGTLYGQNNSILVSWQTIGSHEVVLTVTDSSGNTNSASTTVVVIDATLPVLQQSSLNVLPSSGMIDQALKCSVTANDPFDSETALRYHWDLNPELDSDGNGDERDDPDRIGSSADLTFKQAGTYTVVVTVFDPSNNSDSHAFSIKIGEPAEEGSIAGMLLVVLFIGTLTMGIALVGHRRWQHGLAVELLIGRGLNAAEAKAHIAHVIDARKTPSLHLPWFWLALIWVTSPLEQSKKSNPKQQNLSRSTGLRNQPLSCRPLRHQQQLQPLALEAKPQPPMHWLC